MLYLIVLPPKGQQSQVLPPHSNIVSGNSLNANNIRNIFKIQQGLPPPPPRTINMITNPNIHRNGHISAPTPPQSIIKLLNAGNHNFGSTPTFSLPTLPTLPPLPILPPSPPLSVSTNDTLSTSSISSITPAPVCESPPVCQSPSSDTSLSCSTPSLGQINGQLPDIKIENMDINQLPKNTKNIRKKPEKLEEISDSQELSSKPKRRKRKRKNGKRRNRKDNNTDDEGYKCPECKKTIKSKWWFQVHMDLHSNKTGRFPCKYSKKKIS